MTPKEFASVWTREPRPSKGPGLTRDQIVRAAVELLDAEGLDALSMRKLGSKLGSGATSIYWHVANKHELLELAYDQVWGEMTVPDARTVGWRDAISAFAHSMRHVILRHPWASGLIGRLPAVGPNALAIGDGSLKAYQLAGFAGLDISYASAAVTAYIFGMTIPEVAWQATMEPTTFEAVRATVVRAAAGHPDLLEQLEAHPIHDHATMREVAFDFGLVVVLDGLERRLAT
ncbi:TetR/AcrR family transcriptional regulator C-terminal domain-containing protein [Nonomuraea sp. NPDC050556]|uniref:TetR/AcrR family transcriptional regulator C-terminal domain-containing protein n=1 Tax=Nonomuraea sp. NPDC050556 TaxID=3364369 RepID=UPI00379A60DD